MLTTKAGDGLVSFGREICGDLEQAQQREWLVTNGIGGYASGTIAGLVTRGYHGLLVAALKPPLDRTLLVTKLDEVGQYGTTSLSLGTNRWATGTVDPQGYWNIERFYLDGTMPVWEYAFYDALLEKRLWMEPGENTTYLQYSLLRGSLPLTLTLKSLVNYRGYHSRTRAGNWQMQVEQVDRGVQVTAFEGAHPFFLLTDQGQATITNEWYRGFELIAERDRGLYDLDDNLFAASFSTTLHPEESFTWVATTQPNPSLNGATALQRYQKHTQHTVDTWRVAYPEIAPKVPAWITQLVLAADQFIVDRPLPGHPKGKSVIAGYHWFADWGRDTMISLPGLTLTTNRANIAREILSTFANYISQGMLPNRFPDDGNPLTDTDYNTVDATLWYIEAIRQYINVTGDEAFLSQLFPTLQEIIECHQKGTRFNIHLDTSDGLLYAGEAGVQLTWMDARVGDRVITPRIGKPIEISALWYAALRSMTQFAHRLGKPAAGYHQMAEATQKGFQRFWSAGHAYCFDVLDTPSGNDASLRPNQLFAIAVPFSSSYPTLLNSDQQRQVLTVCGQQLLTSHGLRSLSPNDPQYQGFYGGDQSHRDGAYHQGTVWGWLLGVFALAHYAVYQDRSRANQYLNAIAHHLNTAGLGTISEIFNGSAPFQPKGCIAQAWSVGELLRAWCVVNGGVPVPTKATVVNQR
jgi:predicted glycogen debranching enzyme